LRHPGLPPLAPLLHLLKACCAPTHPPTHPPLVTRYPGDAWELLWGYDQDLFMGVRSGAAIVRDIQAAEAAAGLLKFGQQ
jgi:hypothetical protein